MIRSTPPAEALAGHPVHRATALLRHALLNTASPAPDPAEIWHDPLFRIDPAPADLAHGPVSTTFPALMPFPRVCQSPVTYAHDGSAANASLEEASGGDEMLDRATQMQLQKLAQAFYRRQRQASLLVVASITLSVVLTFAGLFLLFTMTGADSESRRDAMPKEDTYSARHAGLAPPVLAPVRVHANRTPKRAPLLIRAKVDATTPPLEKIAFGTEVILAAPKRPLALGPLLPVGSARYLLLRGLPEQAQLSAGRHTGVGTWMVKSVDVPSLTLTLGDGASGDYPVDVYLLEASDGLQARRRLILRVDETPQVFDGGLSLGWSRPMPDVSQKTSPAATSAGISKLDADAVRDRAQTLFARGDVTAARHLLSDLAARGEADAAYELALTYDPEVLAKAGIQNIDADADKARAWYKYAAQAGHAGAAKRLQMLARPRVGA